MFNAWYKSTLHYTYSEMPLSLHVPYDVFSTQRIDEGTILLLDHLPQTPTNDEKLEILDMGCGYGALGLPIAAKFKNSEVLMVDRDLLAVEWANLNINFNQIKNARAQGSLGYQHLDPHQKFDWIFCNVPARIGTPFIKNLIEEGLNRLKPNGEIRLVVILDLLPTLQAIDHDHSFQMKTITLGARHAVVSIAAQKTSQSIDTKNLYHRDQVTFQNITYSRPFDLGGDDPKRLQHGLPVLIDSLPRQLANTEKLSILIFRAGYGILATLCKKRWDKSQITVIERDLLAIHFSKLNFDNLGLEDSNIEIKPEAHWPNAIQADQSYDLILGELSPSAGESVAHAELMAIESKINKGGQAILYCLDKIEKDWVQGYSKISSKKIQKILSRSGYSSIRIE